MSTRRRVGDATSSQYVSGAGRAGPSQPAMFAMPKALAPFLTSTGYSLPSRTRLRAPL